MSEHPSLAEFSLDVIEMLRPLIHLFEGVDLMRLRSSHRPGNGMEVS